MSITLEDLKAYTYSLEEVNEWFGNVDCPLEIKRSEDGTHLEVWDSSAWLEFPGEYADFKPVLQQRLYFTEDCSEETWTRHLVYSSGCMMACFGFLIRDALAGNFNPDRMLCEFWYVLCAFTKPEYAWGMTHPNEVPA